MFGAATEQLPEGTVEATQNRMMKPSAEEIKPSQTMGQRYEPSQKLYQAMPEPSYATLPVPYQNGRPQQRVMSCEALTDRHPRMAQVHMGGGYPHPMGSHKLPTHGVVQVASEAELVSSQ